MKRKFILMFFSVCFVFLLGLGVKANNMPNLNSPAYSTDNIFAQSGYGGQCTAFCYGRALEKLNIRLPFRNDAYTWWTSNNTYPSGSTPRNNSIAVWKDNTYGHVAFVEEVVGSIVYFNEANFETYVDTNYGGGYDKRLKNLTIDGMKKRGSFTLMGYIYLEDDLDMSKWRITATEGVNIRSGAGIGYSITGALAYNTYFYITERKRADGYTWGKTNGGWVVLDYAVHVSGPMPELQTEAVEPIHKDNIAHVRNGYCTIKNVSSGKFMNVYAGSDANYTPVGVWTYDDSTDQHFRFDHKGNGKYKLYAYCSSRGTNRVVDLNRGTDDPAEGDKAQLWTPDDDKAQLYYIWPVGNDEYVFELASKNGYVLAPNGSGEAAKDGAQLVLQKYTGAAYQKWKICDNNGKERANNIAYTPGYYTVNTNSSGIVRRTGADPYAEILSGNDINDGVTFYVSQVKDFWGFTEHGGVGGWVCLDYTKSAVVLESISIAAMPDKTYYFVGEEFDPLGLKIFANYSNGQSDELTEGFTVNCSLDGAGKKKVEVKYKDKSVSFEVEVCDISISNVSIQGTDLKKIYKVGEKLDTTNLALLAEYNNGELSVIEEGYSVQYDFSEPGTKTVTVIYGGKKAYYEVTVLSETTQAEIKVGNIDGFAGYEVSLPIKMTASGICDGNMTIGYDETKLQVVGYELSGVLNERNTYVNTSYGSGMIRLTFAGVNAFNVTDSNIITVKFKVSSAASGESAVYIKENRLYLADGTQVEVNAIDGAVEISEIAIDAEITNIKSYNENGKKLVSAEVSDDSVICLLAYYEGGVLIECDMAQPENGSVELSVKQGNGQTKFTVWNKNMMPMMNVMNIY